MDNNQTYTSPNLLKLRQLYQSSRDELTPEELLKLKRQLAMAKGNVRLERLMRRAGVNTEELLEPIETQDEPGGLAALANWLKPYGHKALSTLGAVAKVIDIPDEKIRREVISRLLGVHEQVKDLPEVYGTDILNAMGMEEGWGRTGLGLGLEVAASPLTYMTGGLAAGAKIVGGKALSKLGLQASKEVAEQSLKKIGERAVRRGMLTSATELTPEIFEHGAKVLERSVRMGKRPAEGLFDLGGLKFMGESIIPGSTFKGIGEGISGTGSTIMNYAKMTPILKSLAIPAENAGRWFMRSFVPGWHRSEDYKDLFRKWGNQTTYNTQVRFIKDMDVAFKDGIADPFIKKHLEAKNSLMTKFGEEADYSNYLDVGRKYGLMDDESLKMVTQTQKIQTVLLKYGKELKDLDMIKDFRDFYMAHGYETLQRGPSVQFMPNLNRMIAIGKTTFRRKIATATEFEKIIAGDKRLGELVQMQSPMEATASYILAAQQAVNNRNFMEQLIKKGIAVEDLTRLGKKQTGYFAAIKAKTPEEIDKLAGDLGYQRFPLLDKEYYLPIEVSKDLQDLSIAGHIGDREIKELANVYDRAQNAWKWIVTIPNIAYGVRNRYGDMFRFGLRSMTAMFNPEIWSNSFRLLFSPRDKLIGKTFTNKIGIKIPLEQVYDEIRKGGFWSTVIERADLRQNPMRIFKSAGYNPLKQYVKFMEKSNVVGENHTKLLHYLKNLYDGMGFDQAEVIAKRFHYDYKNLTQFEKKVMRRIFPFYAWMRQNTPFMIKQMVNNPGKMFTTIRGEQSLMGGLTDEELNSLPAFTREGITVPLFDLESGGKAVLTNIDLPIDELNELGLGLGGYRALAKTLGSRINPAIKSVLELMAGKDFFYGTPLKEQVTNLETGKTEYPYSKTSRLLYDVPGLKQLFGVTKRMTKSGKERYELDPERKKKIEALTMSMGTRPLAEIGKLWDALRGTEGKGGVKLSLLSLLSGLKVYPLDIEESEKYALLNRIRQQQYVLTRKKGEVTR